MIEFSFPLLAVLLFFLALPRRREAKNLKKEKDEHKQRKERLHYIYAHIVIPCNANAHYNFSSHQKTQDTNQ